MCINWVNSNPRSLTQLRKWRDKISESLLYDQEFRQEIEAVSKGIGERIERLTSDIPRAEIREEDTLLWGDPGFHNLLVSETEDSVNVSGVLDFESAMYGNRMFEMRRARGNVQRRKPPEVYGDPELIVQFEAGYCETGPVLKEIGEVERAVYDVLFEAAGVRWWWDNLGVLHRKTPDTLERIENTLEKLKRVAEG